MISLQHIINTIGLKDALKSRDVFYMKKEINIHFDSRLLIFDTTHFQIQQHDYIDYQCDYNHKRIIDIIYDKRIYRRKTY